MAGHSVRSGAWQGDLPGAAVGQQGEDVAAASRHIEGGEVEFKLAGDFLLPSVDQPHGFGVGVGDVEVVGRARRQCERTLGQLAADAAIDLCAGSGDGKRGGRGGMHAQGSGLAPRDVVDQAFLGTRMEQTATRIEGQPGEAAGEVAAGVGSGRRRGLALQHDDVIDEDSVAMSAEAPLSGALEDENAGVGDQAHGGVPCCPRAKVVPVSFRRH